MDDQIDELNKKYGSVAFFKTKTLNQYYKLREKFYMIRNINDISITEEEYIELESFYSKVKKKIYIVVIILSPFRINVFTNNMNRKIFNLKSRYTLESPLMKNIRIKKIFGRRCERVCEIQYSNPYDIINVSNVNIYNKHYSLLIDILIFYVKCFKDNYPNNETGFYIRYESINNFLITFASGLDIDILSNSKTIKIIQRQDGFIMKDKEEKFIFLN